MSIESRAIAALKWATAAKLVVQIASWAGTLIVVRLLTPEDYGLMAKVAVVSTIAGAIAELGLGAAIVRSVDIARDDLRKIYGVSLLFSVAMTLAIVAAAPLLAHMLQEPRVTYPIAVASLQVIIGSAAIIPGALWHRELSFQRLSKIEMTSGVTSIAVTLLLAFLGAGVWALVLGTLFGAIVRSAALLIFGDRVWPRFSLRGIGDYLKFGLALVGSRVSYFIVVQSDVLIGSAFLSTTEIGEYSVALQLATLPMTKVMGMINEILMPAVARQQGDRASVRQAVLKYIGLMSLIAFPTLWGISAVAPELVDVLFGPIWLPSVPAITILPLVVPIRMVCGVMFTTSLALGNSKLDLRNTIITFVLLPSGFFVGAHWGLVGLCSAWLVSVPLAYSFSVPALLRFIGIRAVDLIAECGPPAVAAGVMYAAIATLRLANDGQPAITALFTVIAAGVVVYFVVIAIISPRHLRTARSFARSLVARDAPKTIE
ncbi:MAG TPA: lipopolysaccharide biosynthesis protein [Burkholderiales bacterium]|nr:lipopolysaccharide biosynthesis protein [Burkholderiales bacterium]